MALHMHARPFLLIEMQRPALFYVRINAAAFTLLVVFMVRTVVIDGGGGGVRLTSLQFICLELQQLTRRSVFNPRYFIANRAT